MKLTKPIIKAFWNLVQCGLWDSFPNIFLFEKLDQNDWESLYGLVKKHAVVGITFPVLEKLPVALRPERMLFLKWCGMTLHIMNESKKMNDAYIRLKSWFEERGVHPILLKGGGVSKWYPQPSLRMAGDIDIYVVKKEYKIALELIKQAGLKLKRADEHDEFLFHKVTVELHTITSHYGDIFENKRGVEMVSEEDGEYRIPSVNANALLLIKHPAKHMFTSGSAIRHLCDWAVFLQQNHGRISYSLLEERLRDEGYDRFAMTFTSLAVEYLGLSRTAVPEKWLNRSRKKQEEVLLSDLMERGDCGNYGRNQRILMGELSFSWKACTKWAIYYGKTYFRLLRLSVLFPGIIRKMLVDRIGHRLRMLAIGKPFAPC